MLWTLNQDGNGQPAPERAGARPHVDEDLLRTVTAGEWRVPGSDLAATVVVERPRTDPDLAATVVVERPPAATVKLPPVAPVKPSPAATVKLPPVAPAAPVKPSSAAAEKRSLVTGENETRMIVVPDSKRYAAYSNVRRIEVREPAPRPSDTQRYEPGYARPYSPAQADFAQLAEPGMQGGGAVPGNPYGDGGPGSELAPRRRGVSRRGVLFAAGGVTLLGGLGVVAGRAFGSAAGGSRPAAAGPVASHGANPSPSDLSSSPARATTPPTGPATGAPSTGPTSDSTIDPAQVQTKPEYYVHNGPKGIALTLDDGPTAQYTPQVLALLQKYGIIATFCMIGEQIPPNAAIVREVVAAGHTVVNHTWDHADQTKLTPTKIRDSIARTSEALNDVGVTPAVFRAPYGSWNSNVFQACADARLRPLDWSVDPQDWARPGSSVIVQRILKQTSTGSIILEHDGGGDRSQTVQALSVVLPELLNAGYRFGPI